MVVEVGVVLISLMTEQEHNFRPRSDCEMTGKPDPGRHRLLFEFETSAGFDARDEPAKLVVNCIWEIPTAR
jgi:hypothetical protein